MGEKTPRHRQKSSSGSGEIIGAAAITVPGAAGETTAALLEKYGVANVVLADGPAGIRIQSHYQKNPVNGAVYNMNDYERFGNRIFGTEFLHDGGEDYYQYCSAIPVGTLLAQTLNGVHTANSCDLCTTAARKEWGFAGIIMTDWTTTNADGGSSAAKCIAAGNDLVMPGTETDRREILDALTAENDQYLAEEDLTACAKRMLEMIFSSNLYE